MSLPISLPPRVVLDTNVVLSALVFAHGRLARLRTAWQDGAMVPLVSRVTVAELMRVLAYPKFRLDAAEQQELLADYLPWCEAVVIPSAPLALPECRDPADRPFLALALAGHADWLVSGDQDLLCLSGQFICPIVNADALLKTLP